MSQPKTQRGRRTRERILSAAAELVHEGGCHATSVDEILKRAGAGKSQFYHYFASKDDLLREVIQFQCDRYFGDGTGRSQPCDTWDKLEQWVFSHGDYHRDRDCVGGCPFGTMSSEVSDRHPTLRQELDAVFRRMAQPIEDGLRRMQERGELTESADPAALGRFVIASIQGGVVLARTKRRIEVIEEVLRHTVDYLSTFRNGASCSAAG